MKSLKLVLNSQNIIRPKPSPSCPTNRELAYSLLLSINTSTLPCWVVKYSWSVAMSLLPGSFKKTHYFTVFSYIYTSIVRTLNCLSHDHQWLQSCICLQPTTCNMIINNYPVMSMRIILNFSTYFDESVIWAGG